MKGGLGPSLLPGRLAERPREALVAAILDGVADTPMPPWQGELTADEADWLVHVLQEGVPQ
jgi:cytochrome c55X